MKKDFTRAIRRAADLGLDETALAKEADIPYPTYWRAKEGKGKKRAPRVRVLDKITATLDRLEAERTTA